MPISIRRRVIVTSVLAAILAVSALVAVRAMVAEVRTRLFDQARVEAAQAVERLALGAAEAGLEAPSCGSGELRSGIVEAGADLPPLARAARAGAPDEARGTLVTAETQPARVAAVRALGGGRLAWAVIDVAAPHSVWRWRLLGAGLAAVVAVIVALSVHTLSAIGRASSSLNASLERIGRDLSAPVEPTRIAELEPVEVGIAEMASALAAGEQQRASLARRLSDEQRLASLGRVASGLAHEVRNGLAVIQLQLDLAHASGGIQEPAARDLAIGRAEVARLDRLVSALLALSGRREVPAHEVRLGGLARQRATMLEPWARERGVRVVVRTEADVVVAGDEDGLARAIDNLLRNAIEASPPDSEVSLHVYERDGGVELEIGDAGAGIEEGALDRLFEPFFTTKQGGTGLGLALASGVAIAHGGRIDYRRSGERTLFTLRLAPERSA